MKSSGFSFSISWLLSVPSNTCSIMYTSFFHLWLPLAGYKKLHHDHLTWQMCLQFFLCTAIRTPPNLSSWIFQFLSIYLTDGLPTNLCLPTLIHLHEILILNYFVYSAWCNLQPCIQYLPEFKLHGVSPEEQAWLCSARRCLEALKFLLFPFSLISLLSPLPYIQFIIFPFSFSL